MIKSDQISSFFKKSGPEITFLTIYDHFDNYDVKKKKRPCEECPCGPGHVRVWKKKNHPIIISNNPIQYSYKIYYI